MFVDDTTQASRKPAKIKSVAKIINEMLPTRKPSTLPTSITRQGLLFIAIRPVTNIECISRPHA